MKKYSSEIASKLVVSSELQKKVETMVLDCMSKVQRIYGQEKVGEVPKIIFSKKGRSAGSVSYNSISGESFININPILLNENVDYIINQTVPHEVAHIIAFSIFGVGIKPHGYEWKRIMWLLNKDPNRCHTLSTQTIKAMRKSTERKKHVYTCNSCEKDYIVSSVIHNRIVQGKRYCCPTCKNSVKKIY